MVKKLLLIITLLVVDQAKAMVADVPVTIKSFKKPMLIKPKAMAAKPKALTKMKLNQDLRKLWADHVIYTRSYMGSAILDLPDADAILKRLLKNQEDLGNAIVPFYGKDAGTKLTKLLKEHITFAGEVIKDAVSKSPNFEADKKKLYDNAKDLAEFLSKANPNWPYNDLLKMFNMHLDLLMDEANAKLKKDWTGDIAVFDKVFQQALEMADALTDGIVKQFPRKFSSRFGFKRFKANY